MTPDKLIASINWPLFRKKYLESIRETSIGVLIFGFVDEAFEFPETLGSVIDKSPRIKARFDSWVSEENTQSITLSSHEIIWMLRK